MTKNAAQLWDVLKANNVPRQFFFHQSGHSGAPRRRPRHRSNRWLTKYLWGQDNGVENLPKSWVVREADQCPPRTADGGRRPVATRRRSPSRARRRSSSATR